MLRSGDLRVRENPPAQPVCLPPWFSFFYSDRFVGLWDCII